jgi:amino acid transporter
MERVALAHGFARRGRFATLGRRGARLGAGEPRTGRMARSGRPCAGIVPWSMSLAELLFGKPVSEEEAERERIGPLEGVPVLGLDALASAAYGPEAALTILLPLGAAGIHYIGPITAAIVALLVIVAISYRQTIAAYPDGGGSYTVAKQNLGPTAGLLAGAALSLDYVLNVAVAISSGVGAVVSAVPRLLPLTLPLGLGLLVLITVVNLRGVRTAGVAFMIPTYAFVACLGTSIVIGVVKVVASGGHPSPVVPPPPPPTGTALASAWLLLRAFASGCTAMTGVEAVSNAVPIFREPRTRLAQRTLVAIIAILLALLAGVALLCRAYGIGATRPGEDGYQSVLSEIVAAVAGRGSFYYVTLATIFGVLCLSANTSFADFPRLCRQLALDEYLPSALAHSGRRLVYSTGIVVLAMLSGALLVAFHGITDHLIPLFAVGAFSAFTLSQAGMVAHWRRVGGRHARRSQLVNGAGALATGATLLIVASSKFLEGAWLTVLCVPLLLVLFRRTREHYERLRRETEPAEPIVFADPAPPVVIVPIKRLDRIAYKGLRFALSISPQVHAVQVVAQDFPADDVSRSWDSSVVRPALAARLAPPKLVVLRTSYYQIVDPLLAYVRRIAAADPERFVAVLVPERVQRRWYDILLQSHAATALKLMLRYRGGPQVVVIDAPWHERERTVRGVRRQLAAARRQLRAQPARNAT